MKRIILGILAFFATLPLSSAMAQGVQMYECVAQKRLAGREEPQASSAQTQLPDGTPRYLDRGDPAYAGVEKGTPLPEWLELFGALRGHGSSFLGFYLAKDFECRKVDG